MNDHLIIAMVCLKISYYLLANKIINLQKDMPQETYALQILLPVSTSLCNVLTIRKILQSN